MSEPDTSNARRDRLRPLKVWVSVQERAQLTGRAQSACLSLSAYLRAAGLGHPIKRLYDLQAVDELAKVGSAVHSLAAALKACASQIRNEEGGGAATDTLLKNTWELHQRLLALMSRV